jgi:hypothetical protein
MAKHNKLLWIGLFLYTVSFFLPAIQMAGKGLPGWFSAETVLRIWGSKDLFAKPSIVGWSLLMSGLINPFFLVTMILIVRKKHAKLARILRLIQLVMLVFPWIVFYAWYPQNIYLREGYVAWLAGILLMLFATPLSGQREKREILNAS